MTQSFVVYIEKGKPLRWQLVSKMAFKELEFLMMSTDSMELKSLLMTEMQRRARISVPGLLESEHDEDDPVLPEGKYKGMKLSELSPGLLQSVWAGWNGSPRLRQHPLFPAITRAKNGLSSQKNRTEASSGQSKQKHNNADWAETHYLWNGEWIPNDVDMSGREGEECPFETV